MNVSDGTGVSPWLRDSPGSLLALFREGADGFTKSQVAQLSGLSRTAINQRVDVLLRAGFLEQAEESPTGGRPADTFRLKRDRGVVLIADTGVTGMRVALCDMSATVEIERYRPIRIEAGPDAVLREIDAVFDELLDEKGLSPSDVLGVAISVPGPVDHRTGRVVNPPVMTGWHDFDIRGHFLRFDCPVIVEKDGNAMAFGEHRLEYHDVDDIVFVKLGTGVGTGLILGGTIYRGADGGAGDVGHIPLRGQSNDADAPVCRCGNVGCIEAYAGGWALLRDFRAAGHDVASLDDFIKAVLRRQPDAVRLMKESAGIVGIAVSDLVNILNPRVVAIGGQLALVGDLLFAAIREAVYRNSLPLATRDLTIVRTHLDEHAGVHGLARLATDEAHAVDRVDRMLED